MTDPRRLLEDTALSEAERRSLDAARAIEPPPELASRVWTDLVMALGAAGAAGSVAATVGRAGAPASAASASVSAGAGAKAAVLKALALGATVGAITTGGAVALTSHATPSEPASVPAAAIVTTHSPAKAHDIPTSPVEARIPGSVEPQAPNTDVAMPSRTVARTGTASESAPMAPGAAPPSGSSIASFDGAGKLSNGAADTARAEARLVGVAREALREGDVARALSILEDAQRSFPNGILLQEREALSISALAAAGRRTEASARAGIFLRAFPNSPHAERVRAAVRTH
jgi:hypothetical protein